MITIFGFALVIILLVLAAQFESFVSAVIIMATVPLGLACAIFALILTNTSLNAYSQIGLVLLVGVMAKNGILIVEFANQLRDRGLSVRAAIDVLASCPAPTALVLGDMGEVGAQGAEFHREVGSYASSRKISRLYAIGEATRYAVEAFGAQGRHFDSLDALVAHIEGKSILVKGSRFMKMERVVAALTGAAQGGH